MRGFRHKNKVLRIAAVTELCLSVILLVLSLTRSVGIAYTAIGHEIQTILLESTSYQNWLSEICMVLIGIELIKMITSHTIDSVVDVMLLAISRQMVVEHTAPLENLIAVLAVGILFLIRRYLYISRIDKRNYNKE